MSVAAVYGDTEAIVVTLCERVNLKAMHEALAVAFTDCFPPQDCTAIVKPQIVYENDVSSDPSRKHSKTLSSLVH